MADESKQYVIELLKKGTRIDGRTTDKYRAINIEYGISSKSAEGSARVTIGETIVVAGVKIDVGDPFSDTPDEGTIMVNTELLPLSSPEFESGPPAVESIELARVVDRGIRESKTLDFKKLCIKSGEKIWMVFIDIYPINDSGNLFDACALAAMAALKDAHFPGYNEETGKVDYHKKTDQGLGLEKVPMACTVLKIGRDYIVDPSVEEEKAMDARLTAVFTEDGNICAMQKGGNESLTAEDVSAMIDLAAEKSAELRSYF